MQCILTTIKVFNYQTNTIYYFCSKFLDIEKYLTEAPENLGEKDAREILLAMTCLQCGKESVSTCSLKLP